MAHNLEHRVDRLDDEVEIEELHVCTHSFGHGVDKLDEVVPEVHHICTHSLDHRV